MDSLAHLRGLRDSITPSPGVCRCLFGPVDREQNRQFMKDFMAQQAQEMNTKYNYDFLSGNPLKGKFQWQKVPGNDQENIPEAYRLPQLNFSVNKEMENIREISKEEPKTVLETKVEKPSCQRALAFTKKEPVQTECSSKSSPNCSSSIEQKPNKEQCNISQVQEKPITVGEAGTIINNVDCTSEQQTEADIAIATDSTLRKRKQACINEYFSIRKKTRPEEKQE